MRWLLSFSARSYLSLLSHWIFFYIGLACFPVDIDVAGSDRSLATYCVVNFPGAPGRGYFDRKVTLRTLDVKMLSRVTFLLIQHPADQSL